MGQRLDASCFWYQVGQQFQTVAIIMDKHRIVLNQQICACGQVAVRVLPTFGLRCDVACEQWDLLRAVIGRITVQVGDIADSGTHPERAPGWVPGRAVGRAKPYRGPATG